MHQNHLSLRYWVLSAIVVGITLWVSYASHQGLSPQYHGLIVLGVVNLALILWIALDSTFDHLSCPQVILVAALISVAGLFAQPLLEDDHFRYLWDGYITATFGTPYALAPSAFFIDQQVPAALQEVLSGINHPEVPTIYGPVLQLLFVLSYLAAPAALWPLKLLLFAALLATILLLRAASVQPRWILVFVLHPLVVKETALSAHPDLFIGLALLAAVLAWERGANIGAAMMVSLAIAMKLSILVALPLFCIDRKGQFSWQAAGAAVLTLCMIYFPVWLSAAGGEGNALVVLSGQWIFNPLVFKVVNVAFNDGAARLLVLLTFVCAWVIIVWLWISQLRRPKTVAEHLPIPPVGAVLFTLLLLSPVINPWYWLWLLPLAVLRFSWSVWTAATLSLLAYAHVAQALDQGLSFTNFAVPMWATWVQMGTIFTALFIDFLHKKGNRGRN